MEKIRFPKTNPARERRLMPGEFERLREAASEMSCWYLWPVVELAIETAMRKGELLSLQWCNIDFEKSVALLPQTKNGSPRWVPFTERALEIISSLERISEVVFPVGPDAVRHGWDRLCKKAEIDGLRFHDLRHEAISRLFELNLTVPEVAFISGHKTPSLSVSIKDKGKLLYLQQQASQLGATGDYLGYYAPASHEAAASASSHAPTHDGAGAQ